MQIVLVHMASHWSEYAWKENSEVYWFYELRIALFSYGAIFPMENSVQNILQLFQP